MRRKGVNLVGDMALKLAVSTLVTILASAIKNPNSKRAQTLRRYVQTAHEATGSFLAAVPDPEEQ